MKRAILFAIGSVLVSPVLAQAWLPDRGEGYVSFGLAYGEVGEHLFSRTPEGFPELYAEAGVPGLGTDRLDLGTIRTRSAIAGFGYAPTARLAIDGAVAYVEAAYDGNFAENPVVDDGRYHGDLQDASFRLRFAATRGSVRVVPFLSAQIPIGDYASQGHAAIGKDVREFAAGVAVGRALGVRRDSGFVQASYAYTYPEAVDGIRADRSDFVVELGYFASPRVTLRFSGRVRETHDGVDWATEFDEHFHSHDVNAKADFTALGATAVVETSPAFDLFVAYQKIVAGENAHDLATWSSGLIWSFGGSDRLITDTLTSSRSR